MSSSARGIPPVTTRIFPGEENPLDLALELSEKLRFSEPCPLSLSDGFRAVRPSLRKKDNALSLLYGLLALHPSLGKRNLKCLLSDGFRETSVEPPSYPHDY